MEPERGRHPHPLTFVLWTLRAWLALLAGYSLAVEPTYTTRFLLVSSALTGLAASAGFALIHTRRPHTTQAAEAIVLASFIVHVMGHAFGLYARFHYYDKALHFFVPAGVAYALYALSQSSTRWIWEWTRVRPLEVAVYLLAIIVTLGVVWELFEFSTDVLAGTHEQDDNFDTMVDLLADFGGALLGSSIVAGLTAYGRRHGFGTISEARQHLTRRLGERAFARKLARRHQDAKPRRES